MYVQVKDIMVQNQEIRDDLNNDIDSNVDYEYEVTKVEVGDNYVIIVKELDEGDPFYIIFCNQPMDHCPTTLTYGWNNTFSNGGMILGGHSNTSEHQHLEA